MQSVVSEKKYEFVGPYHGALWPRLLTLWGRASWFANMGSSRLKLSGKSGCSNRWPLAAAFSWPRTIAGRATHS